MHVEFSHAIVYYLMLLCKFLTLCLFSIPLDLSRPAKKSITTGIEVFFQSDTHSAFKKKNQ